MLQHYSLHPRQAFGTSIQEKALQLVPVYKQQPAATLNKASVAIEQEQSLENSSPVCYAHFRGLREGFQDQG